MVELVSFDRLNSFSATDVKVDVSVLEEKLFFKKLKVSYISYLD